MEHVDSSVRSWVGIQWRMFARNRTSVIGLVLLSCLALLALCGRAIAPFDPDLVSAGPTLIPPSTMHWFGTDDLGRDVLSRVLSGVRVSMMVGLGAAAVSTTIGIVVGCLGGYFGGYADDLLMRITEVFQVIPRFFLAIVLVALFGAHILNIIVAIAILSWPEIARLVRSEVLSLKTRQYVDAARVAGAGTLALIFSEILPNALGPVIVNSTLMVGQAMLLEAGLSYLGLGDPSQVSLGLMLHQAQAIMRIAWWATTFPGLMIFVAVLSFNLVGDGLHDMLNPRWRER